MYFVKKMEPLLKKVKTDLAKYLTSKQHNIVMYNEFGKIIERYEDLNLQQYTDMQARELIFNSPDSKELKD